MLNYRPDLKHTARRLRSEMTDAEQKLWFYLRRKQLNGVQFYRQRPIGRYIVDFVAPTIKLVIEVDGSQHFTGSNLTYDSERTDFLVSSGYQVIRFDNLQVLGDTGAVLEIINSKILNESHKFR
jgi:very-short-patch-repair endonuclease